jgi:DNA damage-binding protein 1
MAAMNYVVTVQRPTAVTAIATGHFTSSTDFNLIVAKNTHFEIYIISSEGLKLVKDVCVYGQINVLKCFRLPVRELLSNKKKLTFSFFLMK